VPIHGEYRMLFRHKEFVRNHLGYAEENVILIENGDVLELDGERASVVNRHEIGRTFIDESGFEEIENVTVRERKQLAYDGIITPVVTISEETRELEFPPEILSFGVRGIDTSNGYMKEAQRVISEAVGNATRAESNDVSLLKERVRVELKRFVQKQTGTRPVITPVIVEI
jgi:ribonuclease J